MNKICFDEFEINMDLFTLYKNGQAVEIGAKPMDLLVCLIRNRDRVVDREFLRSEVWNGAHVSPATIPTCVLAVRKALGDSASTPRFLQSHRARGYRFIGAIERISLSVRDSPSLIESLPFVGRESELADLTRAAKTVLDRREGRVVVLVGEAGIGKTRTIAEVFSRLNKDFTTLSVTPAPTDGAPAFWPWVQLLKSASSKPGITRNFENPSIEKLARVFPELVSGAESAVATAEKTHRHSVFSTWTDAIYALASHRPTILAVDDMHRLDGDSLTLLYWIAENIQSVPMLILGTMRPYALDTSAIDIAADIGALPNCTQQSLPPLSGSEISRVLDPLSDQTASLATDLAQRTGGNPFYLSHLVRCLDEVPDLDLDSVAGTGLPLHAREIVSRQMSGLPHKTREALSAAAVLGDRFSVSQLSQLVPDRPSELLENLSPALDAWIIKEETGCYEFNHSILRESLYQTLSQTARKRLHLKIGCALIEKYEAGAASSEIGHHLSMALPLGDPRQALFFAIEGARDAAKCFAYARSMALYRRASSIQMTVSKVTFEEKSDLLFEFAEAALYSGDRKEFRRLMLEAAEAARRANSSERLCACALGLAPDYLSIEVGAHDPAVVRTLKEALATVPPENIALRAELGARMSQARQWSDPIESRAAAAAEALDLARTTDSSNALLAALTATAETSHGPRNATKRLGLLKELRALADEINDPTSRLLQHTRMMAALLENGDFDAISVENRRHSDLVAELGFPHLQWYVHATESMVEAMRGNISTAEKLTLGYAAMGKPDLDFNFRLTMACQAILQHVEQDRTEQIVPLFADFSPDAGRVRGWRAGHGWALLECGRLAAAREILLTFTPPEIDELEAEAGGGGGFALVCEMAAVLGSENQRIDLYERTVDLRDCFASAGYGVAYFGAFARYSGQLALTLGKRDEAIDLFEHALQLEIENAAASWATYAFIDLQRARGETVLRSQDLFSQAVDTIGHLDLSDCLRAQRKLGEFGLSPLAA